MAEWLLDEGIGEHRAVLVEDGEILETAIDRLDGRPRVGAVVAAKLGERVGRGAWLTSSAGDLILEAVPPAISQGTTVLVTIVREAIPEPGRLKPPRARISDGTTERPAPTLHDRLADAPIQRLSDHGPDRLEASGWSALIDEALTGEIDFPGGHLRLSPTPAMALFDVDGNLSPFELAMAGARAAAASTRRLALGGSIGIDLPTLTSKTERVAVAEAIDAILPQPFERTAVNGFGFVQIVRRRPRPSLPELARADRALTAALALLRSASRQIGACRLVAHPAVVAQIEAHGDWQESLTRRIGGTISLRADPVLTISGWHVESASP